MIVCAFFLKNLLFLVALECTGPSAAHQSFGLVRLALLIIFWGARRSREAEGRGGGLTDQKNKDNTKRHQVVCKRK